MNKNLKINIINNIGAALEYYDYIIFALLTEYLSHIFFPDGNTKINILKTILIFSTGSLAKIFGSIIFGAISDKLGRKTNMLATIWLMAISTIGIGLLPSYSTIGIYAPILLTFLRFLQGLSYSTEIPSTAVFVTENQKDTGAFNISLLISSSTIGAILASFVMYCITLYCAFNEIVMYMWRIPFLLGGMIGILGYWIRKDIPENTKIHDKSNVVKQLSGCSILKPVKAIIIMTLPACLCINNLYFPSILSKLYNYDVSKIYSYITISLIFSAIISPIWGKLIDRFNSKKIIKYLGCGFIILYSLFHYGLTSKSNMLLLAFLLCHQFFLTGFINNAILILTQLFDNQIKCSMVALSYNIAFTLAGFSPVIIKYFEISLFISLIPIILVSTSIYLIFKLNIKL